MTTEASAPKRRTRRWIIAIAIVVVLAVAGWSAGDAILRNVVRGVAEDKLRTALELPDDHPIVVEVGGAMIPQVLTGKLSDVSAQSNDVSLGPITGDISATAEGMRFSGQADDITASMVLDPAQFIGLMPQDGLGRYMTDIAVDGDRLHAKAEFTIFGQTIPVSLWIVPSVEGGTLTLVPDEVEIFGSKISADTVRDSFGDFLPSDALAALTDGVPLCIADQLPRGVELTKITTKDANLVVDAVIDGDIAVDGDLRAKGTCN